MKPQKLAALIVVPAAALGAAAAMAITSAATVGTGRPRYRLFEGEKAGHTSGHEVLEAGRNRHAVSRSGAAVSSVKKTTSTSSSRGGGSTSPGW